MAQHALSAQQPAVNVRGAGLFSVAVPMAALRQRRRRESFFPNA
jgi:hypothetical protein